MSTSLTVCDFPQITGGTWGKGLIGDLSIQAPKLGHVVFGISPLFEQVAPPSMSLIVYFANPASQCMCYCVFAIPSCCSGC